MTTLTVGLIPDAYAPRYIIGNVIGGPPQGGRVFIKPTNPRPGYDALGAWAIPVGTLHTSDENDD